MNAIYFFVASLVGWAARAAVRLPRWAEHRERVFGPSDALLEKLPPRRIWVHNASVGELQAARGFLAALRRRFPGHALVVSATSRAGRDLARRIDDVDLAFYLPLDAPAISSRVVERMRPSLVIVTETEIWPSFLAALRRRGVAVMLVSGRISADAWRRYRWISPVIRRAFSGISLFAMQSEEAADRARQLGAPADRVVVAGSLKEGASGAAPRAAGGPAPVFVAGSTRPGEEEVVLEAYARIRQRVPEAGLLLAPRHLERLDEVEELVRRGGDEPRRWSEGRPRDLSGAITILDTLGELAGLYGAGRVAFVGGTIAPMGGHNLIEPARAGVPVLFGPHVENVRGVAEALERLGGGRRCAGAEGLAAAAVEWMTDDEAWSRAAAAARAAAPEKSVAEDLVAEVAERWAPAP